MSYTLAKLIIEGHQDQVEELIKQGIVNLDAHDEYGFTPLIEAAIANNIEISKLLLAAGAKPNYSDMTGGVALHWAVENNNLELCELLFKYAADPNHYSRNSEPPLVKAILRRQRPLQRLLLKHKADSKFAHDFIQSKVLAHRYELRGHIDIVDHQGRFTEVNLEGFFLESTLGMIMNSLAAYMNNFATKRLRRYFHDLRTVTTALDNAQKLQQCLQYQVNRNRFQSQINQILSQPLLILPIGCAGHATTLVIYDQWLMLCDRRKDDTHLQGIVLYKINKMGQLNQQLLMQLVYEKKPDGFFNDWLVPTLKLEAIKRIMIEPQMTGNCSWANVEASIPAALFLLRETPFNESFAIIDYEHEIVQLFRHWREWDKQRALHFMLHDFPQLTAAQQASHGALLMAVVFQRCYYKNTNDLKLARRIINIIRQHKLDYLIDNYLTTYTRKKKTRAGKRFKLLLEKIEEEDDE